MVTAFTRHPSVRPAQRVIRDAIGRPQDQFDSLTRALDLCPQLCRKAVLPGDVHCRSAEVGGGKKLCRAEMKVERIFAVERGHQDSDQVQGIPQGDNPSPPRVSLEKGVAIRSDEKVYVE